MAVKEREIEAHLISEIKKLGGFTRKVQWIGRRGAPDRIVFFRGVHFIELKRPDVAGSTGGLSVGQRREIDKMTENGAEVWILYDKDEVDFFIEHTRKLTDE